MAKKKFPSFLIYQANEREFFFCLELQDRFLRWSSNHPPTMDVRFTRTMTRIDDLPLNKKPKSKIFDEGFYTITKSDTFESIEDKVASGLKAKSFSFTLNGKKLRGRFAIKRTSNNTVLQKFKDKFATEEDVLSGDLARTISIMVPDYDETKVKLSPTVKPTPKKNQQPPVKAVELPPVEEITADKTIGGIDFHFVFYTAKNEPAICLITGIKEQVLVLKHENNKWVMFSPVKGKILEKEKEFAEHAKALYVKTGR